MDHSHVQKCVRAPRPYRHNRNQLRIRTFSVVSTKSKKVQRGHQHAKNESEEFYSQYELTKLNCGDKKIKSEQKHHGVQKPAIIFCQK